MIKIRLSRGGVRKNPFYRIVATDKRVKNKGKFLELIGYWFPAKNVKKIEMEKLNKWVSCGAKLSAAVAKLIK